MAEKDIIDLLLDDHREFRELFPQLREASGTQREELFHYLVSRLASHEAAEESVVHPALRDDVPGGTDIAVAVLQEEADAEKLLHAMTKMDVDSDEFTSALADLERDVLAHADHEERDEFPKIREHLDVTHRREMGRTFTTLRESGPTRPHPLTPQAPEIRAAVGPLVGIFDRARDAARDAFRR